jgi:hypothetical protein
LKGGELIGWQKLKRIPISSPYKNLEQSYSTPEGKVRSKGPYWNFKNRPWEAGRQEGIFLGIFVFLKMHHGL